MNMRRSCNLFMLFSFVAAFLVVSCGDSYRKDEFGGSITAVDYPGQSAVVLLRRREHTFELFLELVKTYQHQIAARTTIEQVSRIKMLDEKGFDRFGNFKSNVYNKDFHKYTVKAMVISPAGGKHHIGGEDIRKIDVGKGYYEYRIAFPGLEVGSVIEIIEKTESSYPLLSGRWDFAKDVPTLRSELVFKVPRGSEVKFSITPEQDMEQIVPERDGRYDVYRAGRINVPPYNKEILMPLNLVGNPTLNYYVRRITNQVIADVLDIPVERISGEPYIMSWRKVGDAYAAYFDPHTWASEEKSGEYRADIEDALEAFRWKGFDVTERHLGELISWFRNEYQPVDDDLFYFSKNPEESYSLKEGGPFELAYILKYMLEQLGARPGIVLVKDVTEGLLDRRTPRYTAFNHPLIWIEKKGKDYWLDPFNRYCKLNQLPWECRGIQGVRLMPAGVYMFMNVPLAPSSANGIENRENVCMDENGNLTGTSATTITGQHLLNLKKTVEKGDGDSIEDELKSLLGEVFPETFNEESLKIEEEGDDSLLVTFEYSIPNFADVSGGYMNFSFSFWAGSSMSEVFESDAREYDIHFPFLRREYAHVRIELPENVEIKEVPSGKELGNKNFVYARAVKASVNTVLYRRTLTVKSPVIKPEDYDEMKRFMEEVYKLDRETVLLEKKPH